MSVQTLLADLLRELHDDDSDTDTPLVRVAPRIDPVAYVQLEKLAQHFGKSKSNLAARILEEGIGEMAGEMNMARNDERYEALLVDRVGKQPKESA